MQPTYYIGLVVHKRKISYCVKDGSGQIHAEGSLFATRLVRLLERDSLLVERVERFSQWKSVSISNRNPSREAKRTRRRMRSDLHPRSSAARRESFGPLDKDLSWKSENR